MEMMKYLFTRLEEVDDVLVPHEHLHISQLFDASINLGIRKGRLFLSIGNIGPHHRQPQRFWLVVLTKALVQQAPEENMPLEVWPCGLGLGKRLCRPCDEKELNAERERDGERGGREKENF